MYGRHFNNVDVSSLNNNMCDIFSFSYKRTYIIDSINYS